MHAMVFFPVAVFCAVTALCWIVCAAIDQREARAARAAAAPAGPPPRPRFRPVVIEGGLSATPDGIGYFRPAQRPLRFAAAVGTRSGAARSYGG